MSSVAAPIRHGLRRGKSTATHLGPLLCPGFVLAALRIMGLHPVVLAGHGAGEYIRAVARSAIFREARMETAFLRHVLCRNSQDALTVQPCMEPRPGLRAAAFWAAKSSTAPDLPSSVRAVVSCADLLIEGRRQHMNAFADELTSVLVAGSEEFFVSC